jgi:transcriptional regulator with XRE-family HTH domain
MTLDQSALAPDRAQSADNERDIGEDASTDAGQGAGKQWPTNRICALRADRNWTLRKLSEVSGISINALWRIEKGGSPMLEKAFQLASAFQLTIYDVWDIPAPVSRAPAYIALLPEKMRLRALRNARGWRLADLARFTGIPASTLSEVQRGANPSLTNAVRIAVTLGVSVNELWGIPGGEPAPTG